MKRRNATRSALFTSIISLLLCVSMLVGTTFAWFTDSVVSGNNVIAAGNLDVELYHSDNAETDEKVTNTTVLFDDVSSKLWEPGAMAWEKLTVKNNGSLSLKYILSVNIGKISVVDGKSLADVLKVAVLDEQPTRENVAAAATQDLASFVLENGKRLDPKDEESFYVAIYWAPSANDNDYNIAGEVLNAELGVTLYATQVEAEFDSFGNDYDADADEDVWVDGFDVHNENELQAAIDAGQTNIDVMNDIELTETLVIPASATSTFALRSSGVTINLNGKKITTPYDETTGKHQYAIDNYGILNLVGGTIEARGIYNREGASLTVNDTKIVNLDTNGGSSIWDYGGNVVLNNAELIGYSGCVYAQGYLEINGGTYTCYSSVLDDGTQINPTYNIRSYGELVINGGNFTSRHGLIAVGGDDAVINGGTYTMNSIGVITSHVIYVFGEGSEVTINDGTFNCDKTTAQNNGSSLICIDATGAKVNVEGGSYNLSPEKYLDEGYKVVQGENGESVVIPADRNYVADGVQVDEDGNYYIANLAGWKWLDAQADNFFGNKTIKLTANIDFGGETVTGIKFWNSHPTFDGQEYTLSNYVVAHSGTKSPSGLFSGTFDVMNLVIDNAKVTGDYAGAIAGNMYGNVTNCVVKNSTITSTYWQAGALVGQYNAGNIIGCDVENCTISGGSAVGGLIGILNETEGTRKVENCTVTNCAIVKDGGFGGNYDKMFGIVTGLVNIENSTVEISGTYENNTVKGVVSDSLCGTVADGTKVYVISTADNGMELLEETTSGTVSLYNTAGYTGTTLEVPAGVQAIGNYAFSYNTTIETVVLPTTVTDLGRGFDTSTVKKVVLNEGLETISSRAFKSTTALEEVVISSTVEEIADNAFQKSGIKEIVIPANVETIGEAAFGSSKIEKVTIEGNTSIQGYAFRGCPNLKEVYLNGDDVTFIASTLNGRNSMWFCNGESNNPNVSNITFYVVNETVAARVKEAMGAEAANTPVYVNDVLYEG